jgi:xanthine dehydrogenase YagT iron-sulfur-binding subunit
MLRAYVGRQPRFRTTGSTFPQLVRFPQRTIVSRHCRIAKNFRSHRGLASAVPVRGRRIVPREARPGRHRFSGEICMNSAPSAHAGLQTTAKPKPVSITLTINGEARTLDIAPWTTLLDLLRDRLDLTGSKKGCDHGQCGACTVLLDGRRVLSCLTLAAMKDGAEITTIEGLAKGDTLHPLQQAFIDHDAFQCGYCTPGQICSAAGLIAEGRAKTKDDIRELMSGNICRCGAYPNIVAAIEQAMEATGGKR